VKEAITSYVGLDIHKDSVAIAIAEAGRGAPRFIGTINPLPSELCKALRRQRCSPANTLLAYEAGPCGYGWVRYLQRHHWSCEVIAPSRITRSPSEQRVKTDRRDALMLARQLRAGDLTHIVVPDERDEAIRDLSRAREDAIAARLRVRQQMKAMLLRHGRDYVRRNCWSQAHERHLATIRFEYPAQEIAFNEYRQASKEACERVERITQAMREQCESWRMKPLVQALMCLKGFDFVQARTAHPDRGRLEQSLQGSGQPSAPGAPGGPV
jgi:transposase